LCEQLQQLHILTGFVTYNNQTHQIGRKRRITGIHTGTRSYKSAELKPDYQL